MNTKQSTSIVATAAPLVGLLGILGLVGGPLLARLGVLPPIGGFLLFAAGAVLGGLLAVVCGLLGIFRTRASTHRGGAARAWAGLVIGLVLLAVVFLLSPGGDVPAIHDLSTDLEDPPAFRAAIAAAGADDEDWTYPHGSPDSAALQRQAYGDLVSIELVLPPAEALEESRRAAEDLGWTVLEVDATSGRIEASDTTGIFRFVDDVVLRVRPTDDGSVVDVRSKSRVGQSDLGANAERIRAFRDRITGSS